MPVRGFVTPTEEPEISKDAPFAFLGNACKLGFRIAGAKVPAEVLA